MDSAFEPAAPSPLAVGGSPLLAEGAHRLIDVAVAGVVLALAWPLLVVAALLIRLDSPGPAIFRQKRLGRNNRLFTIHKLRTMRRGTPDMAKALISPGDSRITRVGAFLRRTSLDELPQFFNVLRGDMSVVGPRPALWNQYDLKAMRTEAGVHLLKPGVTGLAQISGREDMSLEQKVALERMYARIRSPLRDLAIILATVRVVLSRRGTY